MESSADTMRVERPVSTAKRTEHRGGATTEIEQLLCGVLAAVIGVERVSPDSHFFHDLGADSLVMAHFCARVRKRGDLPSISMRDVYKHPTIKSLAATVTRLAPGPEATPVSEKQTATPASKEMSTPASSAEYVLCGALQVLFVCGFSFVPAYIFDQYFSWVAAGSGLSGIYVRSAAVGFIAIIGWCLLPILVKWVLIGRWKPQEIRIWSLGYFRFWVVKTLIRSNPLVLFVGSPIYVLYLRMLGAKIGRGVVIFSKHIPVCTDLLTIGDNTIIRKGSFFTCYRAQAGLIQTGPVLLGSDAVVGEGTALDINTALGNGAQLGHSSSLHEGQSVPDGERRYGSPAQHRTEFDYRGVSPTHCGGLRRAAYSIVQLLPLLIIGVPLMIGVSTVMVDERAQSGILQGVSHLEVMIAAFLFFIATVLLGLLFVGVVPRVLSLAIQPDKTYPLYGLHYWIHKTIAGMTNISFFKYLFGNSSYVVHYLRWLGYDLSRVEQTGSNFGLDFSHESPFLVTVGRGTMVADGLSIINADYSSSSFRVTRATIGPSNFIGNYVAYPSQSRTGKNCLLATKAMIPVTGEAREAIGLLGSPSFEIPRTVLRDSKLDYMKRGDEFNRRLAAKNKHNALTMGLYLLVQWLHFFGILVLALTAADLYHDVGMVGIALAFMLLLPFRVLFYILVERAAAGFKALQPRYCSIYEREFWAVERYWKLAWQPFLLDGTALKGFVWWLLGVRVGKRVFDDGCLIMDKTMVAIGDDCTLNAGSIIQPHSQEDGAFKSDRVAIGARCTLGVNALIHYGVTMGDGVVLVTDTFLMKGEEIPPNTRWSDNPAREAEQSCTVAGVKTFPAVTRPPAIDTPTLVSGGQAR